MKQPRKIEYPNTRLKREYGNRGMNDLESMGSQHFENALQGMKTLNESLKDSGWKALGGVDGPVYSHQSGYKYDPKNQNVEMLDWASEDSKWPDKPQVDENLVKYIKEQNRLSDLAFASSEFGRDLYHDKDFRSNPNKSIYGYMAEKEYPEREGYDFRNVSTDQLEDELNYYDNAYLYEMPYNLQRKYNEIAAELQRRGKEKRDASK